MEHRLVSVAGVIKGWSLAEHPWQIARVPGRVFCLVGCREYIAVYGRSNFKCLFRKTDGFGANARE